MWKTHTKCFQFHRSRPVCGQAAFAGWTHTHWDDIPHSMLLLGLSQWDQVDGHSPKRVTWALLKIAPCFRKHELSNRFAIYSAIYLNKNHELIVWKLTYTISMSARDQTGCKAGLINFLKHDKMYFKPFCKQQTEEGNSCKLATGRPQYSFKWR